jgi:hypothetical protein
LKPPNNEPLDETNPFAVFSSAPALMAYVYRRLGGEMLKRVLAEIPEADSEWLSMQADQLKELGLKDVAAIVAEAASLAAPLAAFCLADQKPDNLKSSLASHYRKNRFGPTSIEYLEQNATADVLQFVFGSKRDAPRETGSP